MTNTPPITIYGRASCLYCDRAKYLLDTRHIPYRYVDIHDMNDPNDNVVVRTIIRSGYKTVPIIFINGEFIGGYDDLEKRSFE